MNTWTCIRQGELYHHGIKGQKWGVRRFQNKDGSLTPAGKRRNDVKKQDSYVKQRAELDRKIKEYRKEHPNTKLTNSEIETMLQAEET